eukprot:CAMPEP_0194776032 /NCGR_PEP_ID=MMETSP0323_2-20130528/62005_1 /TAXON_ID=2866 ORGANISM="Crypthecodinium cohnii, Strain Seligo" /NCGR_SAMPLE_ID=MMETSP0323_2 /ASSEMBLY_ACC=CAM_ASM_000346 /LENGTH=136 /DNA_ID=CAMNT_0039712257 /DNA_START=325 /DNA_END=736 /DNA_ORIENTATION=-
MPPHPHLMQLTFTTPHSDCFFAMASHPISTPTRTSSNFSLALASSSRRCSHSTIGRWWKFMEQTSPRTSKACVSSSSPKLSKHREATIRMAPGRSLKAMRANFCSINRGHVIAFAKTTEASLQSTSSKKSPLTMSS